MAPTKPTTTKTSKASPTIKKVGGTGGGSKKVVLKKKYIIDASEPSRDSILDTALLEKFLHDKIKINNRTGQLGDSVVIARNIDGDHKITITTSSHLFSKRYIKYLTKKFMKKHRIRDWLRVVATDKVSPFFYWEL